MKRIKLVVSLMMCVFCLSFLVVGVLAAVNFVSFNINTTLSFNPNNCYVEINGSISGDGITNAPSYSYTTDGTDPYPEWNIGNLNLINSINITLSFKNYSTFPVQVSVSGVESGSNYTGTIANNNLYLQPYVLDQTPDSDTLTITYKLTDQTSSVNLSNLNIEITIEEAQGFTYTYKVYKSVGDDISLEEAENFLAHFRLLDDGVEVELSGLSGSFQVEDASILTLELVNSQNSISQGYFNEMGAVQYAPDGNSINLDIYNSASDRILWASGGGTAGYVIHEGPTYIVNGE